MSGIEDLLARCSSHEYDEADGTVSLQAFAQTNRGAEMTFDLRFYSLAPDERWTVRCSDLAGASIRASLEADPYLSLEPDHQLLWGFRDPIVSVSFRGRVQIPAELACALAEKHAMVVGRWIPFGTFLNGQMPLRELLDGGFGQLGKGPRRLMAEYARILRDFGVETSLVEMGYPKRWRGEDGRGGTFEQYPDGLRVLLFGESWVVGAGWTATRILEAQ